MSKEYAIAKIEKYNTLYPNTSESLHNIMFLVGHYDLVEQLKQILNNVEICKNLSFSNFYYYAMISSILNNSIFSEIPFNCISPNEVHFISG